MYPSQRLVYKTYDSKQNTIEKTQAKKIIKKIKTKRTKITATIKNIGRAVTPGAQSKGAFLHILHLVIRKEFD